MRIGGGGDTTLHSGFSQKFQYLDQLMGVTPPPDYYVKLNRLRGFHTLTYYKPLALADIVVDL